MTVLANTAKRRVRPYVYVIPWESLKRLRLY